MNETLQYYHNIASIMMLFIFILISYIGSKIENNNLKRRISLTLIIFAMFQEILDYSNRAIFDHLYIMSWDQDLPFHLCHFGFYFSLLAIYFKSFNNNVNNKLVQLFFDIAYVTGFSGALQGILTVDWTGINNFIGVITAHLQHSLIILNSLWLIFAYKMRFSISGIINYFIFINVLVIPLGIINYFLNSNYLYLCIPPLVDNPLLITHKWPYYIFIIDVISIIYMFILYIPFKIFIKK